MAFNPSLPANNSPVQSAELRSQFTGLKTLIDGKTTEGYVNTAIATQTAGNAGSVDYLGLSVSDPPTQAEVQALANKLDELLYALKRDN